MADEGVGRLRAELAAAGGAPLGGPARERLAAAILALAGHRGPEKSICPSEAARAVGGAGWRDLVAEARETARALAREDRVQVTSRGRVLDPDEHWTGPIRIRVTSR